MGIINFEEAKAKRYSRGRSENHLSDQDDGILELERSYRETAQFYNCWYDEHVVGQDENGGWIYKY